jgi:hypothetical protein
MSLQLILSGDQLVVVEGDSHLRPVEEAAQRAAWIIRHRPFPGDNREIGHRVMRQMLEEDGLPWPEPPQDSDAIRAIAKALEAGEISEAEFVDWVCLRVATA